MMTPRGMDSRRRSGRHVLRHALVLTLAVLLLVGAGFSAWWFALRDPATSTAAIPACPTPTVTVTPTPVALAPAKVKVNVYNAGTVAGLAGKVGRELKSRGFQVAAVANDPQKATLTGPAQLRFGPAGYQAARTVLTELPQAQVVVDDRATAIVDVVLGNDFKQLAPAAAVTKNLATATVTPSPNAAAAASSPSSRGASPAASRRTSPTPTPTPVGTGSARCLPQPTVTTTADPYRTSTPTPAAGTSAATKPTAGSTTGSPSTVVPSTTKG